MMARVLCREVFETLSPLDKIRAYLLLRSTPVSVGVLRQVSPEAFLPGCLAHDLLTGVLVRTPQSTFRLSANGRKQLVRSVRPGLLGVVTTRGEAAL